MSEVDEENSDVTGIGIYNLIVPETNNLTIISGKYPTSNLNVTIINSGGSRIVLVGPQSAVIIM